ncbi:MAG: hypothetical protein IPK82_39645 [Polyangiaceae bacterium]|nr:hypothetical protein [Polyangiaceae bacterium]
MLARCSLIPAMVLVCGTMACAEITDSVATSDDGASGAALILRPVEFLGDTPCSNAPGAMRSYVATLTDHTDPTVVFTLPSSLPTPCSQGIRFDDIAAGHLYSVEIDGYELPATELGPEGWFDTAKETINYERLRSGSRHMQAKDGTLLSPRWVTECGATEETRIIPAASGTKQITSCDPLADLTPNAGTTAVVVTPQNSLGSLSCSSETENGFGVASFDLIPQNGLPSLLGVPCTKPAFSQVYTGDILAPGSIAEFFVNAYKEQGGTVTWGATCAALVVNGLTVDAACTPLSDEGSVQIDIKALLAQVDVKCSGDISSYDASLQSGDLTFNKAGIPCTNNLSFGPLAPGPVAALVTVRAGDQTALFSATCSGNVEPGRVAKTSCILN